MAEHDDPKHEHHHEHDTKSEPEAQPLPGAATLGDDTSLHGDDPQHGVTWRSDKGHHPAGEAKIKHVGAPPIPLTPEDDVTDEPAAAPAPVPQAETK
jgi:hypothetical protein